MPRKEPAKLPTLPAPFTPGFVPQPMGPGATYVARQYADATVELLATRGIISEVIPDGRYWLVKVYPKPPEGKH